MPYRQYSTRQGFTLIELIIVISIIGVLAGAVISTVNIRKNFVEVTDVQRHHNAKQVQNAMFQYLIDESRMISPSEIQEGQSNAKPICKDDVDPADCLSDGHVSLSDLVPDYISEIPIDPVEPCEGLTGYKVYKTSERPRVFSIYMGMLLGDPLPPPDCTLPVASTTTTTASSAGTTTASSAGTTTTTASSAGTSVSSVASSVAGGPCATQPFCNGKVATICVIAGFIVGGPEDGQPYTGTLTGGSGDDVMVGTAGDDDIDGASGQDDICGGGGSDTLNSGGSNGKDVLFGGDGPDILLGGNAKDVLCGGGGDDILDGGNGKDELDGGAGIDTLNAGNGVDDCANGEIFSSCNNMVGTIPDCN